MKISDINVCKYVECLFTRLAGCYILSVVLPLCFKEVGPYQKNNLASFLSRASFLFSSLPAPVHCLISWISFTKWQRQGWEWKWLPFRVVGHWKHSANDSSCNICIMETVKIVVYWDNNNKYHHHWLDSPAWALAFLRSFCQLRIRLLLLQISWQQSFPGWDHPHAQPPAIPEGRCFLSGLSPLADNPNFKASWSRFFPLHDLAI
jgi:hypothetical protein